MRIVRWMAMGLLVGWMGCVANREAEEAAVKSAATRPTDPAMLSLDQIEPTPVLGKSAATTNPAAQAPLEAIELYARARAAQLEGNRAKSASLLEKALKLDPDSFDLNYTMGQVSMGGEAGNETAMKSLERAASIRPDHLDVQVLLGRQYLAKGDAGKAIEQLRLAMQTTEFTRRPEGAAMVNLFLARALRQKGYDLAAIEQYEQLMGRLGRRMNMRNTPELYYLLNRPELIYVQMGELNEKHGRHEKALANYQLAAEHEPTSFGYQSHVVHALLGLKRVEEAKKLAADLVGAQRASSESVSLLKEVYNSTGQAGAEVEGLRAILKQRPGDRSITFALADVLNSGGKTAEAEKLLAEALRQKPADLVIAGRLFDFYFEKGDTSAAARVVVETVARQPDVIRQMQPMWAKLLRPGTRNRLRLPMLQGLEVEPAAQAAKLFLTARLAELLGRDAVAWSSLERAVSLRPAFAPAYHELLDDMMRRADWSEEQKADAVRKLIAQAGEQSQPGLAAELRGMLLEYQKKPAEAIIAFEEAIRQGNRSAMVRYELAMAMLAAGRESAAETLLWAIVAENPSFDEAYLALFRRYLDAGQGQQAMKVVQKWLAADPFSVNARLLQVNVYAQAGHRESAESALLSLFREESDNPAVLTEMSRFYMRGGRVEALIGKLEEERSRRPGNRIVVDALVSLYGEQKRAGDALRVVEGMRTAAGDDAEQLYFVAQLYERMGRRDMTEQVLREALKADPRSGPANNDLGYMWADEGKNLAEAEAMIRTAVSVEPDNAAYLDSLGWVLYKRGKFAEAKQYLDEATKSSGRPDPVVLDHLGDALYRLDLGEEAAKVWQRSMDRVKEMKSQREDLKKLQLQLQRKLEQHKEGRPVDVAPIAEGEKQATQVRN